MRDHAGRTYVLKFDPSIPEKNSAAERVSTLILHAAGYNVPHNSIVSFRSSDLTLAKDAYYMDQVGKRRPLTRADLEGVLKKIKPVANGTYRGLASRSPFDSAHHCGWARPTCTIAPGYAS